MPAGEEEAFQRLLAKVYTPPVLFAPKFLGCVGCEGSILGTSSARFSRGETTPHLSHTLLVGTAAVGGGYPR